MTSYAARAAWQAPDASEDGRMHGVQHDLRDPVTGRNRKFVRAVGVEQSHGDFTPVPGVDRAGRIQHGDAVASRQARARQHVSRKTQRQRKRHASTDGGPLPRGQRHGRCRTQIKPSIARMRR